jgi:hypothetical protein
MLEKPHDSSGQGGSRTPERSARTDLQSASFSHLDTCPSSDWKLWIADFRQKISNQQSSIYNPRKPTTGIEPVTYHLQGGCSAD